MTAQHFPRHHPTAELLLDCAGGGASEAERMMIAAHLALCPGCRRAAADCDAIGGALLDAMEPARLPPNLLNRTLAAIDCAAGEACAEPALPSLPGELPEILRRHLGPDLAAGPWRKLPGGLGGRRLPLACRSGQIVLLRVPPGKSVLRHKHVGDEWTLVLQGGYSDATGHYGKGDFAHCADGDEHKPVAEPGEDCVCMILLRGDLHYTGLRGRLVGPFVRL